MKIVKPKTEFFAEPKMKKGISFCRTEIPQTTVQLTFLVVTVDSRNLTWPLSTQSEFPIRSTRAATPLWPDQAVPAVPNERRVDSGRGCETNAILRAPYRQQYELTSVVIMPNGDPSRPQHTKNKNMS